MTSFDKRSLSERDICTKFITPAIEAAGWDIQTQMREEVYFTKGQVIVRGKTIKRGEAKRADHILFYKPNIPIAVIEDKDNNHSVGDGMQQALDYAEILDVPFAFSSNGDAFLAHDRTGITVPVEQELSLDAFPSPAELWERYCQWKGFSKPQRSVVSQDYHADASDKKPRYYQQIAINRTIEAIADGQDRILLVNRKYVMRITGDNEEGKQELDNFIDPESISPVVVTTSRLMSTGVDAQTCKLIVLDRGIQSMTEFKQIIGRGTRINEDYGKFYFTIMDFRKATELFADKDFDGDPVQIYEPGPDDSPVPPDDDPDTGGDEEPNGEGDTGDKEPGGGIISDPPPGKRVKYYVDDVEVKVVAERVQYYGTDGKLITESLTDYTKKAVRKDYASLDEFLTRWTAAEQKQAIVEELEEHGLLLEALRETVGKDYEPFDLICHVAFDRPPLTRRERAKKARKQDYFAKYGEQARAILDALLDKYADEGLAAIEDMGVLRIQPFNQFGTPVEIIGMFGGREKYQEAIREMQTLLYETAA